MFPVTLVTCGYLFEEFWEIFLNGVPLHYACGYDCFDCQNHIRSKHDCVFHENKSVPPEYIPCINLFLHIIQTSVIAVRNDRLAFCLEDRQIVHHKASKEGAAIL